MRYEAKHKLFKNCLKNFKNITKSLASKHQMLIGNHWDTLTCNRKEYGPVCLFSLKDNEELADYLEINVNDNVHCTNWVRVDGTEYRVDLIVCNEIKHDVPVFFKISKILLLNECIYLIVYPLTTDYFCEHYHAFRVCYSKENEMVIKLAFLQAF